jgi:DNA-binding response OmpR family regulator
MASCSSSTPSESGLVVLVVNSREDDLFSLRGVLPANWTLYIASDAAEAKQILGQTSVPVILCESELPDGNWKDLLAAAVGIQSPPLLIVTSRTADECLWAEVLNLGGYDVLAKPFNSNEFIQVVSTAWRRWKSEWNRGGSESAMEQGA